MVNAPLSAYSILDVGSAIIPLVAIVLAWGRRLAPGASWLMLMLLSIMEWTLTSAVGWTSIDFQARVLCQELSSIGAATAPVFLLFFALEYTRRVARLSPAQVAQLLVIPAATAFAGLTNDYHHLIWTSILPDSAHPGMLVYSHGPLYWLANVYSLVIAMVAAGMLVSFAAKAGKTFRLQSSAVIIAVMVPWASQVLEITVGRVMPWFDPGMTLGMSAAAVGIGLSRYRMLDLVPVARDTLVDQMPDGMMVVDASGRIADVNPSARALLHVTGYDVVGRSAVSAFIEWPELCDALSKRPKRALVKTPWGAELALQTWALGRTADELDGTAVLISDVTALVHAEQLLGDARQNLGLWVGEMEDIETGFNVAQPGEASPAS